MRIAARLIDPAALPKRDQVWFNWQRWTAEPHVALPEASVERILALPHRQRLTQAELRLPAAGTAAAKICTHTASRNYSFKILKTRNTQ